MLTIHSFILHFSTSPWGKALLFGLPAIVLMLRELMRIVREVNKAMNKRDNENELSSNSPLHKAIHPVG